MTGKTLASTVWQSQMGSDASARSAGMQRVELRPKQRAGGAISDALRLCFGLDGGVIFALAKMTEGEEIRLACSWQRGQQKQTEDDAILEKTDSVSSQNRIKNEETETLILFSHKDKDNDKDNDKGKDKDKDKDKDKECVSKTMRA